MDVGSKGNSATSGLRPAVPLTTWLMCFVERLVLAGQFCLAHAHDSVNHSMKGGSGGKISSGSYSNISAASIVMPTEPG